MKIEFAAHFWDRVFGKVRDKNAIGRVESIFNSVGISDSYIEDMPELKSLLFFENVIFYFQETPKSPIYFFDIKRDENSHKHVFILAKPDNVPEDLKSDKRFKNITSTILQLAQKTQDI